MSDQVIIQPCLIDSWMQQAVPLDNYGSEVGMCIQDYSTARQRSILAFSLSSIPPGSTIDAASLALYYNILLQGASPSGKNVRIYKVTRIDWVESQVCWNNYKTGSAWTSAGGDYVISNPSGGSANMPASVGAWVTWDILAIVADAYNLSIDVELIVKFNDENQGGGYSRPSFRTSEYSTTSQRPKLTVDYTPPPAGGGVSVVSNLIATGII